MRFDSDASSPSCNSNFQADSRRSHPQSPAAGQQSEVQKVLGLNREPRAEVAKVEAKPEVAKVEAKPEVAKVEAKPEVVEQPAPAAKVEVAQR